MKRKNLLKLLQPCDIIFTFKKDSSFSKLIWIFSKFRNKNLKKTPMISHSILYIGNNLIIESAIGGGVGSKNIRAFTKLYDIRICRYKGNDLKREKLIQYCTDNTGIVKYAYFQLFALIIKKVLRLKKIGDIQKNAMHCSEFIANAYISQKINLVRNISPAETSPLDIYNSPLIEIIHS